MIKKQVQGITLVALVITIILLLLLAGVAINLSIGSNGIFTRAENAVDKYEIASKEEQNEISKIEKDLDDYIGIKSEIEVAKENKTLFEKDTTIKDDLENEVRVPEGFKIAEDSATKVEDGIVIEDSIGNQFVWIPAKTGAGAIVHTTIGDKTLVYKRTSFKEEDITSAYTETLPVDEEESVNTNGGYYIGRFEAGDKVSTDAKKMRVIGDNEDNEVSIKKGQAPYVYATYDNQKSLAEGMDTVRGYTGTTKMVSSYAWDTAINFIQIKVPDYGTNSPQGNYSNTEFKYANVGETEKVQTKLKSSGILVPTGQTTPVSNIYDMGGNAYERTTEYYNEETKSISHRGGYFFYGYNDGPSGLRSYVGNGAYSTYAFRIALYCSTQN